MFLTIKCNKNFEKWIANCDGITKRDRLKSHTVKMVYRVEKSIVDIEIAVYIESNNTLIIPYWLEYFNTKITLGLFMNFLFLIYLYARFNEVVTSFESGFAELICVANYKSCFGRNFIQV